MAYTDVTGWQGAPISDSLLTTWDISVSNFESVEGLFGIIASAVDRDADVIDATYHAEMGYPQAVYIDNNDTWIDDDISYTISDVVESQ